MKLYQFTYLLLICVIVMFSSEELNAQGRLKFSQENIQAIVGQHVTLCPDPFTEKELSEFETAPVDLKLIGEKASSWFPKFSNGVRYNVKKENLCISFKVPSGKTLDHDIDFKILISSNHFEKEIKLTVKKVKESQIFFKNDLFIRAFDTSIDKNGSDAITIVNTVTIKTGAQFSIQSLSDDDIISSYNVTYLGQEPIQPGNSFCFFIYTQGNKNTTYFPEWNINLNGVDLSKSFNIGSSFSTNQLGSIYDPVQSNSISLNQGTYFQSPLDGTQNFIGTEINEVSNETVGGESFMGYDDFVGIFQCEDGIHICDLEDMVNLGLNWQISNGEQNANDLSSDICDEFCNISNEECDNIEVNLTFGDCDHLVLTWENCTSDQKVAVYYKPGDCDIDAPYTALDIEDIDFNPSVFPSAGSANIQLPSSVGCYKAEVHCEECSVLASTTLYIEECCPLEYSTNLQNITCDEDGFIDLTVEGIGLPPYTYVWDDMSTNSKLITDVPGTHTVTVSDTYGCSEVISIDLTSCCCTQVFELPSDISMISEIIKDGMSISKLNLPYTNLVDFVKDLNYYESQYGGSAVLDDNSVIIRSCGIYENIWGSHNLLCPSPFGRTVTSSCLDATFPNCSIDMLLSQYNNCEMVVQVNLDGDYTVVLQVYNPNNQSWEYVQYITNEFTVLNDYEQGTYRLVATSTGYCPDAISCSFDYTCCLCNISDIEVTGDHLSDEEFCLLVDSLGFIVSVSNCNGLDSISLMLPDSTIVSIPKDTSDQYTVHLTDSLGFESTGIYIFSLVDDRGCADDSAYAIEVENCSVCVKTARYSIH